LKANHITTVEGNVVFQSSALMWAPQAANVPSETFASDKHKHLTRASFNCIELNTDEAEAMQYGGDYIRLRWKRVATLCKHMTDNIVRDLTRNHRHFDIAKNLSNRGDRLLLGKSDCYVQDGSKE